MVVSRWAGGTLEPEPTLNKKSALTNPITRYGSIVWLLLLLLLSRENQIRIRPSKNNRDPEPDLTKFDMIEFTFFFSYGIKVSIIDIFLYSNFDKKK